MAAPPPPPSYEEVAGPKAASNEYPEEKRELSSTSESRPHRSNSESAHRGDRERRRRHKSLSRSKTSSSSKKKVAPHKPRNLDTIDKLDVSAFYGGRFHHDGPFDACTPHRNKNGKNAPVMAFPADGPNNSMKGFAAASNDDRLNLAFGNYSEDQNEIVGMAGSNGGAGNSRSQAPPNVRARPAGPSAAEPQPIANYAPSLNPSVIAFDANQKSAPIHGLTTAGLGSLTFLDGAPAPRADDLLSPPNGGVGRKKSIVQRLRKTSQSELTTRRSSNDSPAEYGRSLFGDEDAGGGGGGGGNGSSLLRRVKSLKVGRK